MKVWLKICLFLALAGMSFGRTRFSGYCEQGGMTVTTLTATSTTTVQNSYPSCTVQVFITGGGTGLVNTSGTAVSWVSGVFFNPSGAWTGLTMTINSVGYTIASCASTTACTLNTTAGTQTSASYAVANAPAALYSDNFGTVLANPFTADSSGNWGFFADDGSYDVRFSGAGIVTPYTRTAVGLFDGTPVAQGTTGTVTRGIKAKQADILSVKDFGAVGNGATDDSNAINLAINASNWGSGIPTCIYFPDGVYASSVALSYNHPVCVIGNSWRIKYTGGSLVTAVFALVGNPTPGSHASYLEGSFVQGLIVDGGGNATNGILLQAVVAAQMTYVRATNVVDAGFLCSWCQQTTWDHLIVSYHIEAFSTQPQRGLVIDNISSANYAANIAIEGVAGNGIDIVYGFNNVFIGGTSEGNGGRGFNCAGSNPLFKQCTNNAIIQVDMEANTGGDVYFGDQSFANTITDANMFSTPSIHFALTSHSNTVLSGGIGCGSSADGNTFGNRLVNVTVICLTPPFWSDGGSNHADTLFNQYSSAFQDEVNNFGRTYTQRYFSTNTRALQINTPSPGNDAQFLSGVNSPNFLGIDTNDGFTAGWLLYNVGGGGMNFMSEISPGVGAVPDGSIVNHNWGWGRYNQAPSHPFHFFDASLSEVAVQAGSGQAGAPLMTFRTNGGTTISNVGSDGKFNGATAVTGGNFTVSGCGATVLYGGSSGGAFSVTTSGTCTALVTMGGGLTAAHLWNCAANDTNVAAGTIRAIAVNTSQVTLTGTTVSGDILTFSCTGI